MPLFPAHQLVKFYLTLSLASLISACSAPFLHPPQAAFLEQRERIVIEAEAAKLSGKWRISRRHSGYAGEGYIEYCWTKSCDSDKSIPAPNDEFLSYPIKITKGGLYQVHLYSRQAAPNGGLGRDWELNNDVRLRVRNSGQAPNATDNTGGQKGFADFNDWVKVYVGSDRDFLAYNNREMRAQLRKPLATQWRWWVWSSDVSALSDHNSVRLSLEPGYYSLDIQGRSDGYAIDRIVIVNWDGRLHKRQPSRDEAQQWHGWQTSIREK